MRKGNTACGALLACLIVGGFGLVAPAGPARAAPMAKITAVTLQVYHRPGPTGQVRWSKVGDLLPPGSLVCTRKRSACEITFPDGSRVRLGARSVMTISSVASKHLRVSNGEIFGKIISGTGAQIRGATATATIKGTWVLFQAPTAPGAEPARRYDRCSVWNGTVEFSTPQGTTTVGDGETATAEPGQAPSPVRPAFDYGFGDGSFSPGYLEATPGANVLTTPGSPVGDAMKDAQTTERSAVVALMAAGPTTGGLVVDVQSARPASAGVAPLGGVSSSFGGFGLAAAGAGLEARERELLGRKFAGLNSQLDVLGLLYTGGSLGGLRARASAISGKLYGEIGIESLTDFGGDTGTRLSDFFVDDRLGDSDLTVGRQRYLEGLVNNSGLGSLFADVHFDGVSYKHRDSDYTIKLSWLESFDAYDRDPTSTHGWLGRVSTPVLGGQVAFNALQQAGDGWGFSGDISLPVLPRQLDMYAELGCDPLGRHLETFGAYFPGLYQSHDIDLFLERARRGNGPAVWSALAYANMRDGWTGILGARKVQGGDSEFTIGFVKSFGSLSY